MGGQEPGRRYEPSRGVPVNGHDWIALTAPGLATVCIHCGGWSGKVEHLPCPRVGGWTPTPEPVDVGTLIERSSLGTPEAKVLRASVSDEQVTRVMARVEEMEANPEPVDVGTREALAEAVVDRCSCGHGRAMHSRKGCLAEKGCSGSGSVADAVFCRCGDWTPDC